MRFIGQPASTDVSDERVAVGEMRRRLVTYELKAVLIFVAEGYDLKRLSVELRDAFSVPVFGCTTAGHSEPRGYRKMGHPEGRNRWLLDCRACRVERPSGSVPGSGLAIGGVE